MSSSQRAQLLPGRNPLASLASCTSVLVLVSDLCHAPVDSQSQVPSSLLPNPKQKHLSGPGTAVTGHWAALLGSGETTTCQSLGVSFHFSGSLLGISTLHLLCLPEQKEFPWGASE